jgi:RNA polymerase sigma-70 factor, ECF subfamily
MWPSAWPAIVEPADLDGLRRALAIALATGDGGPRGPALAPDRGDVHPPSDGAEQRRIVALVDLARNGDAEAFGQLYDHYVESIHRYLYFRLSSVSLADDLTSETFFRALRSIRSFRWQGKDFGAWLTTIARNLITDHYKSSRARFEVVADELPERVEESAGPEEGALATLTSEVLVRALSRLASEQQDCLVMRFCQGLTIAETAKAMGRSDGAIKQLQLRAVRNLAKHLPRDLR